MNENTNERPRFDYEISGFRSAVGALVVWMLRDRLGWDMDDATAAAFGLVVGFVYDQAAFHVKAYFGGRGRKNG